MQMISMYFDERTPVKNRLLIPGLVYKFKSVQNCTA